MSTPTVLAYNLAPERAGRIRTLCAIHRLRMVTVPPEQFGEAVGTAAGILPAQPPAPVETFGDEMLVLCQLPEQTLQNFLHGFRKAGIPPVALKAVLTPTNAGWNARQLWEELRKEHAAMTGRQPE